MMPIAAQSRQLRIGQAPGFPLCMDNAHSRTRAGSLIKTLPHRLMTAQVRVNDPNLDSPGMRPPA